MNFWEKRDLSQSTYTNIENGDMVYERNLAWRKSNGKPTAKLIIIRTIVVLIWVSILLSPALLYYIDFAEILNNIFFNK